MKPLSLSCALGLSLLMTACKNETSSDLTTLDRLTEAEYGEIADGRIARIFTLKNKAGMVAKVTEYGAILVSLETPDRDGKVADITHGYDTLEGWLTNTSYFGSSVGRFGNRIAGGKFTLDGKEYSLATNNDPGGILCHLHGGLKGFDKVLWSGKSFEKEGSSGVTFSYLSQDGEEGYPGNLSVEVSYTLNDDDQLIWEAKATSDAPTILNIVHHSYWNLSGDPSAKINDHELTLFADHYLETDAGLIPTGKLAPVEGTPMDFSKAHAIGERVEADFKALKLGGGYDHAWVLSGEKDGELVKAAMVHDPKSGRTMELSTNQPAVQFYGGNFLDGTSKGKGGVDYQYRTALCLETENYPDAPNKSDFPSAVLRPGETYHHKMVHTFSAK